METKKSESTKVDAYMTKFEHPLKPVLEKLREITMQIDPEIGEEIKWNAPSFFYAGSMEPSDHKLYKRYLAVSNVHYKDQIMLVLPHGADVDDGSGFLEGEYKDGRRLLKFRNLEDINGQRDKLVIVINKLLGIMRG